ncbi:MFS transporter [Rhizobium leguminosarum]|uniref:MFS transporter n=1 Tax=Rhizobium leguminosarum TaxID=384 RepID=UPI00143F29EF|nr:MFS transporter [Rhizobium leguminosarum bv. viciae]
MDTSSQNTLNGKRCREIRGYVEAAGQLVTIFALTYAFSSPLLTTLFGHVDRRRILLSGMGLFVISNILAAIASSYELLAVARVLLAMSAGLYVPNANALGSALVPPERRGRALAIVSGGLGVAVAIGVPLGSFVGISFGWRMPFIGVAVLSSIALIGLLAGLPKDIGRGLSAPSLGDRIRVIKRPGVGLALIQTVFLGMGAYCAYTYVAPFLDAVGGISGASLTEALFVFGVCAFVGIIVSGHISDSIGSRRVVAYSLAVIVLNYLAMFLIPHLLGPGSARIATFILVGIWGFSSWAFFPAQQSRLIAVAGHSVGPIVLSLNASGMYLGFSIGAGIGSAILTKLNVVNLAWVSALFVTVSFGLLLLTSGREQHDVNRR